jgi:hypothetical protein
MRPLAILVAVAVGASAWVAGNGAGGLLYAGLYALAALPGLPLGFRLFGRGQPAAIVAGALIGYVLTAFAIWAAIAAGVPSGAAFAGAWIVMSGVTWGLAKRRSGPLVELPAWNRGASIGLGLVLMLTLAVSVPPFARVGERDAQGNRSYRAYFTADFVWHMALTAELSKFSMPPRNPYLASEPIHYYWTYFLVPAAISQTGPPAVRDVQTCLKTNAVLTGLLLMASVFTLAWAAVGRPAVVTAAVSFTLLAASFEGTYEIYRLWSRGQSFHELRDTNIDAVTAWHFMGHRIDGLPRCLWYVPQHSMAYSLGLVALTAAAAAGSSASLGATLIVGIALAGATAINPFVGGIFAAAWGLSILIDAARRPAVVQTIARHAVAAAPVGLALLWCVASRMVEGAGGVLEFGFTGASRHAPLWSLFLSLGPVLLLLVIGCAHIRVGASRPFVPGILLGGLALMLMFVVRLRVDPEWVPFRAGQMFLVAAPGVMAFGLASMWRRPRLRGLTATAFAVLLMLGLPTTVIDAFNARDIENHDAGPGFHWTIVLDPERQQALTWIRRATPRDAVVQMEPEVREREDWSLIPSFGERRMAGGLPISLMRVPEYQQTSDRVKAMFVTEDARGAWTIAHDLRIDYIYVDALDRARYPGTAKFDHSPEQFTPAFKRGPVGVYQVR